MNELDIASQFCDVLERLRGMKRSVTDITERVCRVLLLSLSLLCTLPCFALDIYHDLTTRRILNHVGTDN